MENSEIRKEIQKEVRKAEKILVGIGAEWKRGDEDQEDQIRRASKALRELLEGKDAFYHIHTDSGGDGGQRF